jgi:hypothetical protein
LDVVAQVVDFLKLWVVLWLKVEGSRRLVFIIRVDFPLSGLVGCGLDFLGLTLLGLKRGTRAF